MTPEREKEIRENDPTHMGKVELLAELDRVRAENTDREANIVELEKVANSWMNDCDQLRAKLELAVEALSEMILYGVRAQKDGTADSHSFYLGKAVGLASEIRAKIRGEK